MHTESFQPFELTESTSALCRAPHRLSAALSLPHNVSTSACVSARSGNRTGLSHGTNSDGGGLMWGLTAVEAAHAVSTKGNPTSVRIRARCIFQLLFQFAPLCLGRQAGRFAA